MIRIIRLPAYMGVFRAIKIYIDDVYRGKIKYEEIKEFEVEKGEHTVRAKMDWLGSNELCVEFKDSIVELEVGSAIKGAKNLAVFEYMVFAKDRCLFLREKGKEIEPDETLESEERMKKWLEEKEKAKDEAADRAQKLRDKFGLK